MNKTIQALKSTSLDAWRWSSPGEWCYGLHYRLSCWRFVFFQNIYSPSTFEASLLCEACVTKSSVACLASTFCFEKVKMIKSLDFPFLWPRILCEGFFIVKSQWSVTRYWAVVAGIERISDCHSVTRVRIQIMHLDYCVTLCNLLSSYCPGPV